MRGGPVGITCVLALALCAALEVPAVSAADLTPGVAAARQASLHGILTTIPANAITAQRMTCMMGEEPGRVIEGRRAGKDFIPDAADTCVAVLVRTAQDHGLPDLYRTLLIQLGGNVVLAEKLPLSIGDAVLNGNGKIALGNGKTTDVPPSLAFDAGFTAAWLAGDSRAGNADPGKLKAVTEACLSVRKDAATCFSTGYAQAGRALQAAK